MKALVCVLALLWISSMAEAKDIQLLNTEILGQSTSSAIKSLQDKKSDEIEPFMTMHDIKCGKYHAASLFYPKKVTFSDARKSLNKLYKSSETLSLLNEPNHASWRVEDKQLAITLTKEEDLFRIIYIQFRPFIAVTNGIDEGYECEE